MENKMEYIVGNTYMIKHDGHYTEAVLLQINPPAFGRRTSYVFRKKSTGRNVTIRFAGKIKELENA